MTIKDVTRDLDGNFQFNTAISRIMELVNQTYKTLNESTLRKEIFKDAVDTVFSLLAPFMPHISEEVNSVLGSKESIFRKSWPKCQEKYLEVQEMEIAVLVNGKVKDKLVIDVNWAKDEIESKALALDKVQASLKGNSPKKVVYVEKRIVNIVA
jgi:leucyl-tRNA synthetase